MRRFFLYSSFALLVTALFFLWQYRFERAGDSATVRLSDLKELATLPSGARWIEGLDGPELSLEVKPGGQPVVVRMGFPGIQTARYLYVRSRVSSVALVPGGKNWEDGRCIIEWHPADGTAGWENDPVCSTRHDSAGDTNELVARPEGAAAAPVWRVENLGRSGEFRISVFEVSPLQERSLWKYGRWLLMAGWVAWMICWIHPKNKAGLIRAGAAAMVWLVMGLYFVVPGPWKSLRSFIQPFQLNAESVHPDHQVKSRDMPVDGPSVEEATGATAAAPVGEIEEKGFTLRLKKYAAKVKQLLHVALLLGPTLLVACLAGRRPAWSLAILFSLAVEVAQVSFGFGCDWIDIVDLASDAGGIALALWLHRHLQIRFPRLVAA